MSPSATAAAPTVEGHVQEKSEDKIILDVPQSDYQLHLKPTVPIEAAVGSLVKGIIRVKARRVDVMPAGGCFVEPVYGRPRRVQGTIVGGDVAGNELFVQAAVVLVVKLMPAQKAGDFAVGQIVGFDAEPGASFALVR